MFNEYKSYQQYRSETRHLTDYTEPAHLITKHTQFLAECFDTDSEPEPEQLTTTARSDASPNTEQHARRDTTSTIPQTDNANKTPFFRRPVTTRTGRITRLPSRFKESIYNANQVYAVVTTTESARHQP